MLVCCYNTNVIKSQVSDIALKGKKPWFPFFQHYRITGICLRPHFFKLFAVKIAPILFYGAELWGTKMYDSLERLHIYACKLFFKCQQQFFVIALYWATTDCARKTSLSPPVIHY